MAPEPRYHLIDTTSQSPIRLGLNYLTLSHCWGKVQNPPYRTTPQNIGERLRIGIARNGLPPTFKDAIDVALRLRVPFLWIDSSCIIQGDKYDWAVECTKMADVYMNSFLNISATSASSSEDGVSSSFELHPKVVTTGWENEGRAGKYRVIDPDFWRDRVTDAQVNSRGWVLQERCLAPRVLHFGFDQLLWECCALSACEEFPDGIPTNYVGDYVGGQPDFKQTTNFLLPAIPIAIPQNRDSYRKFHDIWQDLGNMYGRCELSKPDEDKLMAISGLARAIQHGLNDQYLAGLWKKNMIGDLLWLVRKTRRRILGTVPDGLYQKRWDSSKRATSYQAPSWSWASVDGLVRLGEYLDLSGMPVICEEGGVIYSVTSAPIATILDVDTSLVRSHDPFGQVCSGKLVVRGQLHRLGTKQKRGALIIPVFRATEEMVLDHVDEPLPWSIYDEAYFLPLASVARRCAPPSPQLTKSTASLREEYTSQIERYGASEHRQDSESTPFNINHVKEELAALDREDYYDIVAGVEICPTQDRSAFRRIGYMDVQIRRFRKLGGCMPGDELWSEVVFQGNESVCKPDTAARGGNMVIGKFEIV